MIIVIKSAHSCDESSTHVYKSDKKRRQGVLIEKILIKRRVCRGKMSQVTAQEETKALKARG